MTDLLNKISSYNIFNYLLPGVLFAVAAGKITHFDFTQENILVGAFVYYFIGMVLSRLGSLIVEPILRLIRFVKFEPYKDYVSTTKVDSTIEVLSEANNTYRTIVATLLAVIGLRVYEILEVHHPVLQHRGLLILCIALTILFVFAYRKQTGYITTRIKRTQ